MADCNACTPQTQNPPGRNCKNVPNRFTIIGRGSEFVDIESGPRQWKVQKQKYGPSNYTVKYTPVRWSCTCKDFTKHWNSERCCKHIMMCIDTVLSGSGRNRYYSGTVYPSEDYLQRNVTDASTEATYHQWHNSTA